MTTFYTQIRDVLGTTAVIRVGDDGIPWWLGAGENDPEYLAWLAEGNTPEPWEPN